MFRTKYASIFKRLVAHLLDRLVSNFLAFTVVLIMILISTPDLIEAIMQNVELFEHWTMDGMNFFDALFSSFSPLLPVIWITVYNLVRWLYIALFESSHLQASPGKMLFGIFVTDVYGKRISFGRGFLRAIGKDISNILFGIGYLIALFTERKQALHDFLAGTLVLAPQMDYVPEPPASDYSPRPESGYPAGTTRPVENGTSGIDGGGI